MSTGGPHPRQRHATSSGMGAGGAVTRDTHGIGFSPVPTDPYYGSVIDYEAISPVDIPQIIVADEVIVPGTISPVLFAESIRAPTVVDVLPTLPDAVDYPIGSLVFFTPDGKLYRNVANAWTVAVDGTDIVANSITAGQIAVGAIGADEIATGALRTEHLSVGTLRANLLLNGDFDTFVGTVATYSLTSELPGWTADSNILSTVSLSSNTKSGLYIAVIKSNTGAVANAGLGQYIPVRQGRTYRLSGWAWKGVTGGGNAQILCHAYDKDGAVVAFNAMVATNQNTSTPTFGEDFYTVPAGVAQLRVLIRLSGTPTTDELFAFDSVTLEEVPGGMSNGPAEVVIDDTGIAVSNGKITVSNGSSVVIIDGSSNMFKIVASGTLTRSQAALSSGVSSVSFPGAGLPAGQSPAYVSYLTEGTSPASNANRYLAVFEKPRIANNRAFGADSLGGATNTDFYPITWRAEMYSNVNGSSVAQLNLAVNNGSGSTVGTFARYHLLKEAAI